uniref:Uncharacterized protein n=1 Tax=Rhizophora mucronata TaxID=61149 RepID=A0A2P2M4N0_RHIMU
MYGHIIKGLNLYRYTSKTQYNFGLKG